MDICRIRMESPVGTLLLGGDDTAVTELYFLKGEEEGGSLLMEHMVNAKEAPAAVRKAKTELEEYFAGARKKFTVTVRPEGTTFQKQVWKELEKIPYGETRTYGQIAAAVGSPRACRAVGMANHNNPISIIVPCHRVIGSNGKLTGYGGGLDKKEILLKLEKEGIV